MGFKEILWDILWEMKYVLILLFAMIFYTIYRSVKRLFKRKGWIPRFSKWASDLPKEYVNITLIASGVSIACIFLYVYTFNENSWTSLIENLLPNIIIDAISIVITAFIITHFINKAQERKAKRESFLNIRIQHSMLVSNIAARYITMMTKRPHLDFLNTYSGAPSNYKYLMYKIGWVANSQNAFIHQDFFEKEIIYTSKIFSNIKYRQPDDSGSDIWASPHQYVLDYFLKSTKEELEVFITKYAAFIPKELTTRIVNLESMILADKELVPWLPNKNRGWTNQDHIDTYKELGNRIYALLQYYEEFYQDKY